MEMVSEIIMKPIGEIKPYDKNPRKNNKTVDLLCDLIPKVGFNVPLVIDQNGIIVKGHARYAAAIRLGLQEVPCIIDHADPEAVKIDRITDNKIAEYSEWMNEELAEEIDSINTDIDLADMGFLAVKLDEMPAGAQESPVDGFLGEKGMYDPNKQENLPEGLKMPQKYYKCVCKECGHVMFIEESKIGKR